MSLRATLLILSFAATATSAPAPFPKSGGTGAEVVFEATTAERAQLLEFYLRSKRMKETLAEMRRMWVREPLRIEVDDSRVRVYLDSPNAVATLADLVGIVAPKPNDGEMVARLMLDLRKKQQLGGELGASDLTEVEVDEYEIAALAQRIFRLEPPSLIRLRTGVRRK